MYQYSTKASSIGLQIAVIHDPPRLSFHSVHDGREIRSIEIASDTTNSITLSGVWWLNGNAGTTEEQDSTSAEAFSGPLRRDNVIVSGFCCLCPSLLILMMVFLLLHFIAWYGTFHTTNAASFRCSERRKRITVSSIVQRSRKTPRLN